MLTKREPKKTRRDPREETFYSNFFGLTGASKGNALESALAAGYDESKAAAVAKRLIEALDKSPFKKVLQAAGLTKSALALIIADAIKNSTAKDLTANLRVALKLMGELEEGAQAPAASTVNVTGSGAQILIVEGATADKMKALRAGSLALKEKNEPK